MCEILITGATGFIGRELCQSLVKKGYIVRAAVRSTKKLSFLPKKTEFSVVGEIGPYTDWIKFLNRVDTVIHLAARVHLMAETAVNPLDEYRRVNVDGTKKLARISAESKVKRIIYLSTIKVSGEKTDIASFNEEVQPHPEDPYAQSKWEAEQVLQKIAKENGLEIVIIRPPLVYGPGVKANFLQLLNVINRDIPLPFASINNRRSFIYIENLVDAIITCINHPRAAGQTFLVSDGQDVSTPDLIRVISCAMGKKARLFPCPISFLKMIGKVTGKNNEIERLVNSLQIDNSKIKKTLNWTPPYTMDEGIYNTVRWYKSYRKI